MQDQALSPDWIELLRSEVAKEGKSVSAVARDIDMPRPSLSMLLNGTYPGGLDKVTEKFSAKVLVLYRDQLQCPHIQAPIGLEECKFHAGRPISTSNPARLRQHNACRNCPQNPITQGATE